MELRIILVRVNVSYTVLQLVPQPVSSPSPPPPAEVASAPEVEQEISGGVDAGVWSELLNDFQRAAVSQLTQPLGSCRLMAIFSP